MTTVAIMQPYFVPYAGYFRLFAAADVFVAYDCVQFPRRGFVHRNKLTDRQGELRYLTLPLAAAPRDTRIDALAFRDDAAAVLHREAHRFPALRNAPATDPLMQWLLSPDRPVADYLVAGLRLCAERLDVGRPIHRSSALGLSSDIRGQDRILAIAKAFGARAYVNAPGGRDLYDPEPFRAEGIALGFLRPVAGAKHSILERLLSEDTAALAQEIRDETVIEWA